MFKKFAASVALVSVVCMASAFADDSDGSTLEAGGAGVVSNERTSSTTMIGTEGVFKVKMAPVDTVFGTKAHIDANASLGGAGDPTGKQSAAVTGGAEINIGVDGYKDAQPGDFQLQALLNLELIKARPYTASQGIYIGTQADWGSGKLALLMPLFTANYDRLNGTFGLGGALAGIKLLGEQNITNFLKIKAALEGKALLAGRNDNKGVMTGGGYEASGSLGLVAKVSKNVSVEASFIADAMSMELSDKKADGTYAAAQSKTVVPLTGMATATVAW